MTDRELMQQALDAFEYHVETAEVEDKRIEAAIYALRTVLAQPEQEPVAWYHAEEYKTHFTTEPTHDLIGKYWQPLYTAPRPWVGLTDGELRDIAGEGPDYFDWKVFGRAIEAKLRERNT